MSWQIAIDEPNSFELLMPSRIEEAVEWMQRFGSRAALLAGGCDLVEKLKTQWCSPEYVINLKSIPGLREIETSNSALTIGALTTLSELERHNQVGRLFPGVAKAASRVATPQIRNLGTIGGNLLQDSRCSYYRGPWNCYRKGGVVCDALHGLNADHALFGGDRCFTVTPSDLAPMMVALEAVATVHGPQDERRIPLSDLYLLPKEDIHHMHRLAPEEILTQIEIPVRPHQHSTFIKYAIREAWDFALASIAVTAVQEGDTYRNCRIVLGAVAPKPWRSREAERVIEGSRLTPEVIAAAARAAAEGAEPLSDNEYKVNLIKKLVRTSLQELAGRMS